MFGSIDTLVCNAALNPYYGPEAGNFRRPVPQEILDNNIVANHWLISLVVPQMIKRKDGSITIISSIGGLEGSTVLGPMRFRRPPTCSSRVCACEYGPHNIRVNCIAPGLIKTDFAKALWDNPETLKASTARSPLLRIGEPIRNRRGRGVSGFGGGQFHDRANHRIDGGATIS